MKYSWNFAHSQSVWWEADDHPSSTSWSTSTVAGSGSRNHGSTSWSTSSPSCLHSNLCLLPKLCWGAWWLRKLACPQSLIIFGAAVLLCLCSCLKMFYQGQFFTHCLKLATRLNWGIPKVNYQRVAPCQNQYWSMEDVMQCICYSQCRLFHWSVS